MLTAHLDVLVALGLRDLIRKVGLLFESGMSVIQLSGMCPLNTNIHVYNDAITLLQVLIITPRWC